MHRVTREESRELAVIVDDVFPDRQECTGGTKHAGALTEQSREVRGVVKQLTRIDDVD
jgi:hypothetical protein